MFNKVAWREGQREADACMKNWRLPEIIGKTDKLNLPVVRYSDGTTYVAINTSGTLVKVVEIDKESGVNG